MKNWYEHAKFALFLKCISISAMNLQVVLSKHFRKPNSSPDDASSLALSGVMPNERGKNLNFCGLHFPQLLSNMLSLVRSLLWIYSCTQSGVIFLCLVSLIWLLANYLLSVYSLSRLWGRCFTWLTSLGLLGFCLSWGEIITISSSTSDDEYQKLVQLNLSFLLLFPVHVYIMVNILLDF